MATRPPFVELEHTADVALGVYGRTWEELLVHAAQGMFYLIGSSHLADGADGAAREVVVEADDRPALLVEWLAELLTLHDTHGEVYGSFELGEVTAGHIAAKVRGRPIEEARLQLKAVTYHDLALRETEAGWEARVTFDV